MSTLTYPAASNASTEKKLAPSPAFRQQTYKVIASILLFLVVYLLLVAAATLLAAGCMYAGFALIVAFPRIITIILGIGLMALGLSVIFFLIKFVFSVTKSVNDSRIEITEEEQPRLFAFIRELTEETNTLFPKKIYLSPDVNACVFYNSSFWSMFLPVRKNLEIGLGLVNALNASEFKAVMAHEFGHFSQRSMKLGSFTYNVNRIIYNMLYENNSYTTFLELWGNIHGLLAVFAMVTFKIAQSIQWILKSMYAFINKSYMALSREMEFHADAVAASVAGGNNVLSGLIRSKVADSSYSSALRKAEDLLKQNKICKNIFDNQLSIFHSIAKEHDLPIRQGLPEVSFQFLQSLSRSRINYKDQWTSHPTLEERKRNLEQLDLNSEPNETRAWTLFDNPEALQEKLTSHLYRSASLETAPEIYDASNFSEWHKEEKERYTLPPLYKGFYDLRYPEIDKWDIAAASALPVTRGLNELFSEENIQLCAAIRYNESDLLIVKSIKDKQIDVKSFDLDGIKYSHRNAADAIALLEKDIEQQKTTLDALDREIFSYFRHKINSDAIVQEYAAFAALCTRNNAYIELANKALEAFEPLYGNNTEDQLRDILRLVKEEYEPALKKEFQMALDENIFRTDANGLIKTKEAVMKFLSKDYAYIVGDSFQNEEWTELNNLIHQIADEWGEYKFSSFKNLLDKQADEYSKTLLRPAT